ncbi:MAG TPA: heme-copper oxidase subunit III [Chloroflexi bacterium]|nr:heme-copper oxidase subunit III [Chloroflexota bacterium]HHW85668.1 heme-copper oxidase subunit III [Chloroflexota bacterium]
MAAITTAAQPTALHHDTHAGHDNYAAQLRMNRLGLWLFFISEAFLFGGLLATRFFLWGADTRPELDQTIGLIVTSVLLISSVSMRLAETAIERGNRRAFSIFILLTALFGLIFLAGVMVFEWGLFPSIYQGHLTPWDNKYGAVVFAMTGMHALHVISGIVFILIVWNLARKGSFSPERHWGVESCAIYWHYVDVVWIFFYPALYLIGNAVHIAAH